MNIQRIDSKEGNVTKFVFTEVDYVAEAVLYKYPDYETRTVICCSTMSGCPMGCRFCGAGDFYAKTLSGEEITNQVDHCIGETGIGANEINRLQIMFMSMGEPLLNPRGLKNALIKLYEKYPNAALLVSTSAPKVDMTWFNMLSSQISNIGLQFSVHESTDENRDRLIPFKEKMTLSEMAFHGHLWRTATGRNPFFNYCAHEKNNTEEDADRLVNYFNPSQWEATVSVVCERNEGLPARNEHQRKLALDFSEKLLSKGYNVRVFDPAGQDDIGGGCGQLWFVQKWAEENKAKARNTCGTGLEKIHVPSIS